MLLSTSFILVLAAVERALFASAVITDPGSDLQWHYNTVGGDPALIPQAVRPGRGATILSTGNLAQQYQNADTIAAPSTDNGLVRNIKTSMNLARNGLYPGGYARSINKDELPIATDMSGGDLRQQPGTTRALHWHDTVEWGYVFTGVERVTCMNTDGQIYVADVPAGDIWNFPHALPHSIQAKTLDAEVLIAFDQGDVGGDSSWLLVDWLAHVPKSTLAKNFGWTDPTYLNYVPTNWFHSFNSTPPPDDVTKDWVIPNNTPNPYTFALSQVTPTQAPGGSFRITDSRTFKVATDVSAIEVTVNPGHMRELHYHPYTPQWTYFISGEARMTVFAPGVSNARTFNFVGGDIGYVPKSWGHYVENTGNTTLKFLEILRSDIYSDVSAQQWMALVPKSLIKGHFNQMPDTIINGFKQTKQYIV